MGSLSTGGGSSAVAASAHAGCPRFRMTDPLITQTSRKSLAADLGSPDTSAGIPEARWMRAMTFERLVHSERFVSELLTKAVGQLGLPRPDKVRRRSGKVSPSTTAKELSQAHLKAAHANEATMLTSLAIPFAGLEDHDGATSVKPDFAIICQRSDGAKVVGSWLIMGDAKDYERVRSRIDDGRLLKGFLQVALGAESADSWSLLPEDMAVHRSGALAVPRNAFLQPEASVERLDDYRTEVRARAAERIRAMEGAVQESPVERGAADYVAHLDAEYDPATCTTCNLFRYCRNELRHSQTPEAVLVEIGIDAVTRPAVAGLVNGTGEVGQAPQRTLAQVEATATGLPVWSHRLRTDPAGLPGTINVVLAKSDSAALGVHGIAIQRVGKRGAGAWTTKSYVAPQAPQTRRSVMALIGRALRETIDAGNRPVHLVVPDRPTADVLASTADSLAGVELSRLRWQHDLDMGRKPLTFDGEPATLPDPLTDDERLGVSFLLEEDRARAMSLRSPLVDLRSIMASHLTAGGPASDSGRLDYLVRWAQATEPLDHRAVSDEIADELHTPGARLSNAESDKLHNALKRISTSSQTYKDLVNAALDYKIATLESSLEVLALLGDSRLRDIYRVLESDAQEVWERRVGLRASDLVRFSRTYRTWRNAHVEMMDKDAGCATRLTALVDYSAALDSAQDAGVRELAVAEVIGLEPIRLKVHSRRLVDESTVVALHTNGNPLVEADDITLKVQGGSFKFGQLPLGALTDEQDVDGLTWSPRKHPNLEIGDELLLADAAWFGKIFASGHEITVARPSVDNKAAPKPDCTEHSYENSPEDHQWCCRPHEIAEAEWSDTLAERRSRGELNPQTWPPLVDEERFDVGPAGQTTPPEVDDVPVPDDLTLDDVD